MGRIPVLVHATDPILKHGVRTALRPRPEVEVVESGVDVGAVVLLVTDRLDDAMTRQLSKLQCRGHSRIVLVVGEVDDNEVLTAVEYGVCAVARRAEATPEMLVRLVRAAAAGEGALPPDVLGRLLTSVSRLQRQVLQPKGMRLAGISAREGDVLRLVAAGLSTQEIAAKLSYSQRTVKAILHDVTNRFQLRNRSHAVAYAMREGLI
ncbi:response regulator transcription factor [Amycolatopsis suaedae]|uniref:Response regulator transcription factor n=1 Tax=Amycolatopsis suaedae TaxID=2510978 RepID=A0A4Q7J8N0_9PSEU|nr:response regulator transcription factor [Amycolatopsis suaedae]RZQ62733.1 response regulator transcription factor [Amycolatopsis suaedae]